MFDLHSYALFLATAVVLVLSPGPDTVLILSRTIASGTRAGLMTLVGTQVGNIIHAVLAGVGVSTVILFFPIAFTALKIVGVFYLLYLAFMAWRAPATLDLDPALRDQAGRGGRFFVQGLANNLANPKMIAFFLALFPQFVRPEAGSLALQSFVLGSTLALMAVAWIGFVVVVVGRFRAVVASSTTFLKIANRLAAVTFAGLACRLALEESR
ncbi:LysE family translocator [Methylobacterium nonmethylotrophicum]|uniref:LysE family translocator n=1 Tax=Methylobacterium nonmethylotrophicum TaxID=1141884 RepID=A0A4Z0NH90_9HYPH|nr:LysE family translocator [Methylobacterium nonmethylotrophicum]TGD94935.1 LysE family translocator [Methylobacterium nonmethylotrophicum]